MKNYTFYDENKNKFKRVDKRTARRAYNAGVDVRFCPVNLRPFNRYGFGLDMTINKNDISCDGQNFETVLNAFEFYNCRDTETGFYTAFYINENETGF